MRMLWLVVLSFIAFSLSKPVCDLTPNWQTQLRQVFVNDQGCVATVIYASEFVDSFHQRIRYDSLPRYSSWVLYKEKRGYSFDFQTNQCSSFNVSDPWQQPAIPANSQWKGSKMVGRSLTTLFYRGSESWRSGVG